MDLIRVSGPLRDPFFETVRRRHPDVDIVLLPPEEPPATAEPGPPMTDEQVGAEFARVAELAADLCPAPLGDPVARVTFGDGAGTVLLRSRLATQSDDGAFFLTTLRDLLSGRGWQGQRLVGDIDRFVAEGEQARVTASYSREHDMFIFEVSSASMYVGRERARTLVRGQ